MPSDLVEDRSDESYVLEIRDITLTPPFPEPGKELRWEMAGHLKEQVDLAQVECQLQVKLGLVTLMRQTVTLPETLKKLGAKLEGDTQAPAGPWKQTWTFTLPQQLPKADFRIYLQSFTGGAEEKDFMDLNLRADFRRR
ncbi:hypothetical protein [Streptomyces sp. NPDC018352]|uniref:hypothetical protein n=1 Tax=Streptomyces sp. NPDC018352 TaxID=3157194 RepID=UPI00340EB317